MMIVRLDDNGRCINLKLREKLEVRLPESMVSGYVWEYKEGCPALRLDDSDYAERGPARFHNQGERSWHFAAVATGECKLNFYLVRPWSAPSLEYSLSVAVK
jgi:inhibitor of cysteine peptidase